MKMKIVFAWAVLLSVLLCQEVLADDSTGTSSLVQATPLAPAGNNASSSRKSPLMPDDIKALFAAHKYRDAMDATARLLSYKGTPVLLFDRRAMLLLRVECMIQLKQYGLAGQILDGLCTSAEDAGDLDGAAQVGSLALLVRRSTDGVYIPKLGVERTPINIFLVENRTNAYSLLFADELAATQKKVGDAHISNTLNPVLEIAKTFDSLRCVERVVTHGTFQTDPMALDMATTGGQMMAQRLDTFNTNIMAISRNADRIVTDRTGTTYINGIAQQGEYHRRGIDLNEYRQLHDIDGECQQMVTAIDKMLHAFGNADILKPLIERAKWTEHRAQTVLAGQQDPGGKSSSGLGRPLRSGYSPYPNNYNNQ